MDAADRSTEYMALTHDVALANARNALTIGMTPIACGECHNCGASVPEGHRWCDATCRDDWQRFTGAGR